MTVSLNDPSALENYFQQHPETPLFPLLAERDLQQGNLDRARKICQEGLKIHPESLMGKYLLARIEEQENNLVQAEKLLKQVVAEQPVHVNALKLLWDIQIRLDRRPITIAQTVRQLKRIFPQDENIQQWLTSANLVEQPEPVKQDTQEPTPPAGSQPAPTDGGEDTSVTISKRLATMTLVRVFKNQGQYHQALAVLEMVAEKGADPAKVLAEREDIQRRMAEQESIA